MAQVMIKNNRGSAHINIAEDAPIIDYGNAFIELLRFEGFSDAVINQLFGTDYFEDDRF